MHYQKVIPAVFADRPNRFIAEVILQDGSRIRCHVKNTGRCAELFRPGVPVYLSDSRAAEKKGKRKTRYDLIAVEKDGHCYNVDSQAPNQAVREWLEAGALFRPGARILPEKTFGTSRLDFFIAEQEQETWLEVKGVTLEKDGDFYFPDAPTDRGLKHIRELCRAVRAGKQGCLLFVIQTDQARCLKPNMETQPEFGEALREARNLGVRLLAYTCAVTPDTMRIADPVPVLLPGDDGLPDDPAGNGRQEKQGEQQMEKQKLTEKQELTEKQDLAEKQEQIHAMAEPLLDWYAQHARTLPWRSDPTPYHVWISEIMLQQTRVEAVKGYYQRFMDRLPDVCHLAEVPEAELLKLWEGLGYYNRARNLQKAAIAIVQEWKGMIPSEREELLQLPGIGSYTAGAIASIAYGKPAPAVDGNVLRVFARLLADESDITRPAVKKEYEALLQKTMNRLAKKQNNKKKGLKSGANGNLCGACSQALMDLGATVCVPNGEALCRECPLQYCCKAREKGLVQQLPVRTGKKPRTIEQRTILVIRSGDQVVLQKRPSKGLLAGLYEFPNLTGWLSEKEAIRETEKMGYQPLYVERLEDSRHIFTHKEWLMHGYLIRIAEPEPDEKKHGCFLVRQQEAEEQYPIPSALHAYTAYAYIKLEKDKQTGK